MFTKKIVFLMVCMGFLDFTMTGTTNNGFYYGKRNGIFPQSMIYVEINDGIALAHGFYPFKGSIFDVFLDTLSYSKRDNVFRSKKSLISFRNGNMYFERQDSLLVLRVNRTKIKYDINKINDYEYVKRFAVSPQGVLLYD